MRYVRLAVLGLVLLPLALANTSIGAPATPPAAGGAHAPDEVLVKFGPDVNPQVFARSFGASVHATITRVNVHVLKVPSGTVEAAVRALSRNPLVLFAEPNGVYYAIGAPNDPDAGKQWQYNNTGQTGGATDADIDAFEAWEIAAGSNAVAIAILDTGIDQSHEDLKAKITKNVNFTSSKTVDDRYGHGTHVAGSAAAVTGNGKGVAGTCPGCVLYNVKVLGDNGSGYWSWIANGITWAADNGARVINMSLGGSSGSATVEAAVNYAWGKGVVVVAAAGNEGTSSPSYPAYYERCIAVAATDHNDAKPGWSNYGSLWVDVAAPGVDILSTAPDHNNKIWKRGVKYGTISGTSMASPHVAGVAGLVWSGLCSVNVCVRDRVESTADSISGTGSYWAKGRINACRAVGGICP